MTCVLQIKRDIKKENVCDDGNGCFSDFTHLINLRSQRFLNQIFWSENILQVKEYRNVCVGINDIY